MHENVIHKERSKSKVFKALSFYPSADTIKSSLPTINELISHVYTDEIVQLTIARFNLYLRCRSLRASSFRECTIPTHQAFQAGWIWGTTFDQERVPSVFDYGRKKDTSSQLTMDWAPDLDRKILNDFIATCKHPKSALSNVNCLRCGCAKKDISCIEQCSCRRKCASLWKIEVIQRYWYLFIAGETFVQRSIIVLIVRYRIYQVLV